METYKRSVIEMIKGIVGSVLAGVVLFYILSIFTENYWILFPIPVLVAFGILYMTIFSDNIHFELEKNGELRYYQKGKLLNSFKLNEYFVGFYMKKDKIDHYIELKLLNIADNTETVIECGPLGVKRFEDMYERIKSYSANEIEVLKANTKEI